jgi:uracil-DNA glycosylase
MKISYNKGKNISSVAFMFACPGQKEQAAGKVVAGATGKNLNTLLSILAESKNEKIRTLFPSADRYDYLITNASDTVHYPALDKTSLPSKKEYGAAENVARLCSELE